MSLISKSARVLANHSPGAHLIPKKLHCQMGWPCSCPETMDQRSCRFKFGGSDEARTCDLQRDGQVFQISELRPANLNGQRKAEKEFGLVSRITASNRSIIARAFTSTYPLSLAANFLPASRSNVCAGIGWALVTSGSSALQLPFKRIYLLDQSTSKRYIY
jgi:hypothetical protein